MARLALDPALPSNQPSLSRYLFAEGTEPADCIQGQLGDCWLLSAFACLAEDSREIEGLFVDREFNPRGRYSVRIYDAIHKKNVIITIDDRIPCDRTSGRPCFTTPNGDELWVCLLEKAFAKFCGSYHALEGGLTAWALEAMTGDRVYRFSRITPKKATEVWGVCVGAATT